ncbi:MAG: rhodanese-like domain-containing protein [Pseudomonadales bacterium]|uniref:Rhodanese domain-containing protein n=1 Tax=Oleiphilus messinensis TaxID=141451 RepID=A0A1Y0I4J6_9GAMM|nr:rhodanese-like domain-containing protein [Oleiphilus messinensis]ARU55407.1 rhodanese domain-containing protein [Oleiphilus messinensis]MCG8612197.1 rhodanese-like domain-containing protein [Pseudomonadales bacterium]
MRHLKYVFSTLFLFAFANVALAEEMDAPESVEGTTRISAEDLIDLVDEYDDLVLIDSRIPKDRAGGKIEGSVSLPDTETTPAKLAEAIATKSTPVIFYCNGVKCGRSVKASKMAVAEGYSKVYWFRGGWEEWTNKGLPISK